MEFPEQITIGSHSIKIIPRYVETDKAGVVHHSVFPIWFEMGRTELLRANKVAYSDLEAAGVFFVVADIYVKYRQPAFYDEQLALETSCTKVTASRIEHSYKLTRSGNGLIVAEGKSTLACVGSDGKIQRIPDFMYPED